MVFVVHRQRQDWRDASAKENRKKSCMTHMLVQQRLNRGVSRPVHLQHSEVDIEGVSAKKTSHQTKNYDGCS